MKDRDYFEYMRGTGEWTQAEKLNWEYLSAILETLQEISGKLSSEHESPNPNSPNLMGQYRIYSGGMSKGTPKGFSSFT